MDIQKAIETLEFCATRKLKLGHETAGEIAKLLTALVEQNEALKVDVTYRSAVCEGVQMQLMLVSTERDQLKSCRESTDKKVIKMQVALSQASFCLRELLPNDADAQMTVQMIATALEQPQPLSGEHAAEPIECECCGGTGTIDERLGGYGFSNPAATCPDCDGHGEWTPLQTEGSIK